MSNTKSNDRPSIRWLAAQFSFAAAYGVLLEWGKRRATRRHLSELDDHQLTDIGLTRKQQEREAALWFWK